MKVWVLAAVATIGTFGAAFARQAPLEMAFSAGRVSVSAVDVPVADVLAAWARAGHTELTGAEYLGARRLTIRLTNTLEADALRAIVGSRRWYSTVARETPAPAESTFQRIMILPTATAAADSSSATAAAPENRYTYFSDPEAAAGAAAISAILPAPDVKRRPANVDPESFYQYGAAAADPPDALKDLLTPPEISREPLHRTLGVIPEVLYTYSPTPQPAESSVTSSVIPPTPALDPEVRYTYDPIQSEIPPYMLPGTNAIPNLPMVDGWTGLRLPGRVIRYVREN
jgi:hypothetical protein